MRIAAIRPYQIGLGGPSLKPGQRRSGASRRSHDLACGSHSPVLRSKWRNWPIERYLGGEEFHAAASGDDAAPEESRRHEGPPVIWAVVPTGTSAQPSPPAGPSRRESRPGRSGRPARRSAAAARPRKCRCRCQSPRSNRPNVDSAERSDDFQRRWQIELQPAMALRHEQAKDADRSQRFHQIGRDSTPGLDLRCARGDVGRQFPNIGEQTLECRARSRR